MWLFLRYTGTSFFIKMIKTFTFIVCCIGQFCVYAVNTNCPCKEPSLCEPIKETRKEVFAFSLENKLEIWSKYDWNKLTTIVTVGFVNPELMCLAHEHGTRIVNIANIPKTLLPNATARAIWLKRELNYVQENFMDGLNIDFEDFILQNETIYRDGYTKLIAESYAAFKKANPYYQVTVDVAWSPFGVDLRYYDYLAISNVSDFLFVMAYDEQSQIRGPCVAGPNSPVPNAITGIKGFLQLGIPANKLVLGVPWYGYLYTCMNLTSNETCVIKHVPFRGVNCSDAAGREINYYTIKDYLNYSKTGLRWNSEASTPYFTFSVFNQTHQVHFDDPKSLSIKYELAHKYNLRGVGMWNTDALDYISNTAEAVADRIAMWAAIPKLHEV